MEKEKKSYYQELDNALQDYEKHKILCLFWDQQDIERICNYICLYGECKYITEEQMEELADRCCKVLERMYKR